MLEILLKDGFAKHALRTQKHLFKKKTFVLPNMPLSLKGLDSATWTGLLNLAYIPKT
jgi:hypothetical protein